MGNKFDLKVGNCLDVLKGIPDNSFDSVITDPPYGISFMGKHWDYDVPSVEIWKECMRVLKPEGSLLSFAGTRTQHRMVSNTVEAGLNLQDVFLWCYGSGFPKSHNISKAIDKMAGEKRELRVNERWADKYPNGPGGNLSGDGRSEHYGQAKRIVGNPIMTSDPVSDAAKQWEGWGTALKPAHEPISWYSKGAATPELYKDVQRLMYCAKAAKKERGEGNNHPTVKPIKLMSWLCNLVTPPGGLILDPFMGSGSTGVAALQSGFDFVGVELSEDYTEVARRRIVSSCPDASQDSIIG